MNIFIYSMKKHLFEMVFVFASIVSLTVIQPFRNALMFNTHIAYAANEPWYAWMTIDGEEVQIEFETVLKGRALTLKDFNDIYGFNLESGSCVVEQWCSQCDNSRCEMRFVGSFLNDNGHLTLLPVTPALMYY